MQDPGAVVVVAEVVMWVVSAWHCVVWHVGAIAAIAQLGERQTEDLKVPGSIPGLGIFRHHHMQMSSRCGSRGVPSAGASVAT